MSEPSSPGPTLEELIDAAAKVEAGTKAGNAAIARIFHHYPELTPEGLAAKFRESADRNLREADELEAELARRRQ